MFFFRRPTCYIENGENKYQTPWDLYLLNHFRCPPYREIDDIKGLFSISKKPDTFWVRSYVQEVIDYINQNATEEDYVFVYTNQPGYYYFIKAKSPTRFTIVSMADNTLYRKELFDDLKKNQPKLILYTTGSWEAHIEGLSVPDRFPELEKWFVKNYPKRTNIQNAVILSKE